MKYKICKNQFGKFKIIKWSKPWTFLWIFKFKGCWLNHHNNYGYVETFDSWTGAKLKIIELKLKARQESEEVKWVCSGEDCE